MRHPTPGFRLAEKGPAIEFIDGRPTVGLYNANPFTFGIANLGAQVVAKALLDAGFNVEFAFADSIGPGGPFLGRNVSPPNCDVLAFSIPFEDTYHHVPRLLRASNVPVRASARKDEDPIVIAGGMALINPMPLSPFMDAMVLGNGRHIVVDVCEYVNDARARGVPRRDIVRGLAAIPHVYVPGLYAFDYDDRGNVTDMRVQDGAPTVLTPARYEDLNKEPSASLWTTSRATYSDDDYYSIMVAAGCHKKCPFCVVGNTQGEESGRARNLGLARILELAEARRTDWGTNLVKLFFASSFSGASSINPLDLQELLEAMIVRGFEARVGSLNILQSTDELMRQVKALGQKRLTYAPETGATLRPTIGKAYSKDERLLSIVDRAGRLDLGIDLYTMVGLPGETYEHVAELATLIDAVRRTLPSHLSLETSANPVFTKAQTPYERYATLRPEESRRRLNYIWRKVADPSAITWVTVIDDPLCYYQPINAMGGPEVADVLEDVSVSYHPTEDQWKQAVARHVGSDERYFAPRKDDDVLPWQHIVFNDHERLSARFKGMNRKVSRESVG